MKRPALILAGFLALPGCRHEGYQRERSLRAIHIFGIGWLREKTATNDVKAFVIGSMDTGYYQINVNTNAPMTMVVRPAATSVRTNVPVPLGVPVQVP